MVATGEKLILCAGPFHPEGFKTLDCNPAFEPDYLVTLPPFPRELRDGRWDEIYLIHGIEHFYLWEAEELISQVYEALAPGGLFIMEQPNVKVCAEVMLGLRPPMTDNVENSGLGGIYGDPSYGNPYMGHKWGWTPDTLAAMTTKCGFNKVKTGPALSRTFAGERDFRLEATK